jgi:predicted nucleic-acid-binding Zn-ribbon protein
MALHHDQLTRINEWLAAHVCRQCPTCGLSNWWQVQDGYYGLPCVSLDTLNVQEGLEFIATTCKGCGYTAFFLAKRMGLDHVTPTKEFP